MDESNKTRISLPAHQPNLGPAEACVVLIYGGELGRRHALIRELTVGRDQANAIVLEMDNVSRRHARFFQVDDTSYVEDLGSTNGTFINDTDISGETPLANGDLIKIGGAIFKFISGGNIEGLYHEEIYLMTIIDGLTQIHNKRYFADFLEREMARCSRYQRALSLAMLDIDHFKTVNDTYGHLAGDHVLQHVAQEIKASVRGRDIVARYGGEEFAVLLRDTPRSGCSAVAENVRATIERGAIHLPPEFGSEQALLVTVSIGVAWLREQEPTEAFVDRADRALYESKEAGRNRVSWEGRRPES